ncbi:MAG: DUF2148 domain-containing protein [Thermodesulfobacteriota bacterium]
MPRITMRDWPPYSPTDQQRRENAVMAARLMMNGAMTAPSIGGIPMIEGEIVYGEEEQEEIARKMEELAYETESQRHVFLYEAVMARRVDALLLLGNTRAYSDPWDGECGLCAGRPDCSFVYEQRKQSMGIIDTSDRRSETIIKGPLCAAYAHQLGYNVGSALMVATHLYVDARPFITMGMAAQKLGYCRNSGLVVGIGIAARSKFEASDPGLDYHLINLERGIDAIRGNVSQLGLRPVTGMDYKLGDPSEKR